MLHVHCGDSSADTLRQDGAPGEVISWSDTLWSRPLPADVLPEEWRQVRARHLSAETRGELDVETAREWLARQDEAMAAFTDHDEVVLWFDHCLYDQMILIRHLYWFAHRDRGDTKLSLICIGEFPGMPAFKGLGELSAEQLLSLLPERHEVTTAEIDLASRTWAALRSCDPRDIETMLASDTSALPYLEGALWRHLQQFPSTRNGLSRLQQECLTAVSGGAAKLGRIFVNVSDQEERPFFGDTSLWACLDELAAAHQPALSIDGSDRLPLWNPPRELSAWTVRLTETGERLLAGDADWITVNGIDRWQGGVHLTRSAALWRWDEAGKRLVAGES